MSHCDFCQKIVTDDNLEEAFTAFFEKLPFDDQQSIVRNLTHIIKRSRTAKIEYEKEANDQ